MSEASVVSPAAAAEETKARPRAVRARAFLLGIASVAALCLLTPYNDYQLKNTYLYGNHFPLGCVFLYTLVVLGANTLLRRYWPRQAFTPEELILFWCMLICGAGLASSGLMRYLGPMVVAPYYYQTPQNHWEYVTQYLPAWLVPTTDPNSILVKGFFDGIPPRMPVPWQPWVKVLFGWGALFALLTGWSLCLCVLLRRQWVERERLVFPLVTIPVEMARAPEPGHLLNSFFRSRLMWIGFAVPVLVHTLNGLHSYFVSLPQISRTFIVGPMFSQKPWWGLGIWSVEVYLCVIGLAFMLSAEVSFSLWATYLLFRLVRVARVQLAMDPLSPLTPNHEIAVAIGSYFAWGAFMVWLARPHLRAVFRRAFRGDRTVDDADEPMRYRTAILGGAFCFAGIVAWSWAAGMSPGIAALAWGLMTLTLIILTRAVAEGGLLFVQSQWIPTDLLVPALGSSAFSTQTWSITSLQQVIFMHDPREALMPSIANVYRMRDAGRSHARTLLAGIVMAIAVGLVVSFFAFINNSYRYGGCNLDTWGMVSAPKVYIDKAIKSIDQPTNGLQPELWNVLVGIGLCAGVIYMRLHYLWWPFHPIGLVLAPVWAMHMLATSIFIAWFIKVIVMRFGGLRGFRGALPFFLGLVLGDGFTAGMWALVGLITGTGVPRFLPG